jgi:lipopolysaccharide transport system ATP-binding protein
MTETLAISLQNVSKRYKRYRHPVDRLKEILLPGKSRAEEFWALRDIDLAIPRGNRIGIIGRNGAGKSTLLQIIAGTLTPTEGSISIHGRVSALLELGNGFDPEFTGRENVFFSGRLMGLAREEIQTRFDDIAAFADIGDFLEQPVKTYSSGMYVRLAFALAVNVDPDILIIDEALAVGDAAFQFKSFSRLERLMQGGVTVILVSHDMGSIKSLCDQVLYLQDGRLRAFGNTDEVTDLYALDVQSQQRLDAAQGKRIKVKPSLPGGERLAFGTDQGHIVAVKFLQDSLHQGLFAVGEPVAVEVTVEYRADLDCPSVCLSIENRRSQMITGKYLKLSPAPSGEVIVRRRVIFSFAAKLVEDTYFLTARLESRQSQRLFSPVDKQTAALSFQVVSARERGFLGLVDLNMEVDEVGPEEQTVTATD